MFSESDPEFLVHDIGTRSSDPDPDPMLLIYDLDIMTLILVLWP